MSNYYEYENGGQMGAAGGAMPMHQGVPAQMQSAPMQGGMPMQQPQQQYGYRSSRFGMRSPRMHGSETKPFFLTSEFVVSLLASIGIAITAASSTAFGAWRAWILIAALVAAYTVSRGIAKCGTRSNATDPRENLELSWGRSDRHEHGQQHGMPTAPYGESQYAPPA
jgi:hypothetical protein